MFTAISDDTFDAEVLRSDTPVIVHFTAPWCRPCRAIEPHLVELANAHAGTVRLVSIDIDANLATPSRYRVLSIPTVVLFANGKAVQFVVGAHGKRRFERAFAPYLPAPES